MIRNLRWGDVAQLKYGKSIREYPQVASDSHRYRVFGTNGPIGWHTTPLVPSPGIIIGRKGAYRGVHFSDSPFFVIDTAYYLDIFDPEVDVKWAYYQLLTVDINRLDSGSAIPSTKREDFDAVPVRIPLKSTQKRIADILSAYDDLIENNRRRMALLEESARLLYQEWFVRLRFPGHEHLRITNGVPEGWQRNRIGDIAECVGGGTPSTKVSNYWDDGEIAWVTPTDVTRNEHFVLLDSGKKITNAGLQNSSAKLVPPHAVLMTSRASVGFFAVAGREVCTNQGFISVVPNDPVFSTFLLLQLSECVEQIRGMGSGSTFPEVSRGKFREFQVQVPHRRLVADFDEQATLFLRQIRVLKLQNQKLGAARDLLLPRLMNGEVAV